MQEWRDWAGEIAKKIHFQVNVSSLLYLSEFFEDLYITN